MTVLRVADVRRGPRFRRAVVRVTPQPVRAARLAQLDAAMGARAWFLLEVAPRRELWVARRLEALGVFGFCPTQTRWRRPNGQTGRKREIVVPAVPGYVLAGFDRAPDWSAVLGIEGATGVVGAGGVPRPMPRDVVEWLARRSSVAPECERWMVSGAEFVAGASVRITQGAMEGCAGRVVEITGQRARVLLPLFGGEVSVEAALGSLVAAQ